MICSVQFIVFPVIFVLYCYVNNLFDMTYDSKNKILYYKYNFFITTLLLLLLLRSCFAVLSVAAPL